MCNVTAQQPLSIINILSGLNDRPFSVYYVPTCTQLNFREQPPSGVLQYNLIAGSLSVNKTDTYDLGYDQFAAYKLSSIQSFCQRMT